MKSEAVHEFFTIDGEVKNVKEENIFSKIIKSPIYEIIRVVDGVPTFLEDHLNRMFRSASLVNHKMSLDEKEIRKAMKDTILKNKVKNSNIKLLSGLADGVGDVFLTYFVETSYPPKEYYENGIKTILYEYERDNPNAKVFVTSFKEDVAQKMKERDVFEALLINRDGYIPEGSRSNAYFVKQDKIYTGPPEEVLLGITRKHVFKIAENLNIPIVQETINKDYLEGLEGAFISGTGMNILPISQIEDIKLPSKDNKIIADLNKGFDQMVKQYVEEHKNLWE